MTETSPTTAVAATTRREHPVSQADRSRLVLDAFPDAPALLTPLRGQHVLSIGDYDAPLLRQLMRLAARYEGKELAGDQPMRCRILSSLFMDDPACSGRLSFKSAWLRLGGSVLDAENYARQILSQRYTPEEVAELCNNYSDIAVLRTEDAESFHDMLPRFRVPVINAGDGAGEHPSHAMGDLYTLCKWRPELFGEQPPEQGRLTIALLGDRSRTRTLRSFLRLLCLFPQAVERVILYSRVAQGFAPGQREELEQAGIRVDTLAELYPLATDMEIARELVPTLDLIYVHFVQPAQVRRLQIVESMSLLKPDAMVLSPQIPTAEAAHLLNDSAANGYFAQARGAVYVRMALFSAILG
jgi:aspartate carbamoyltransferase catalytic subunit